MNVRIAWKFGTDHAGSGEWQPQEQRHFLQQHIEELNRRYGIGTHWLESQLPSRGGRYNWIGQPERLIYLGPHRSNGVWHQFAKVEAPEVVWCEVREAELIMFEETKP